MENHIDPHWKCGCAHSHKHLFSYRIIRSSGCSSVAVCGVSNKGSIEYVLVDNDRLVDCEECRRIANLSAVPIT